MSIEEVAEYFSISTRTVRRMMSRQELSANRIGGQWRIPIVPLYWGTSPILRRESVKGLELNLLGQFDWTAITLD